MNTLRNCNCRLYSPGDLSPDVLKHQLHFLNANHFPYERSMRNRRQRNRFCIFCCDLLICVRVFVRSHHTNPFIKGINQPFSCVCQNAARTWKNPSYPGSFLSVGSWESGETGRTLRIKRKDLWEERKACMTCILMSDELQSPNYPTDSDS